MAERLKDMFFTEASVNALADVLKRLYGRFDKKRFIRLVFDDVFDQLELKQMMRHTTECLCQTLPKTYKQAVKILMKAAPEVKGFEAMCLPDYVELRGLDDWDLSLEALACFTKFSSSEFAIRPFLIKDAKKGMAFMKKLAGDPDPKVRRFASEGCRPRLPWAMALPQFKKDPSPILPVLEKLKDDESEFVRNSVANNLNDISRDHPATVLNVCEKWQGKSEHTDWIIKHACRTMLKAGDRRAMMLFGFGDPKHIGVDKLKLNKKSLAIGNQLQFSFLLNVGTKKACKVRLEYIVYFARPNDKVGKKVFQIAENSYKPGEHALARKHSFADLSTRKHYPGKHEIAIVVNGVEKAAQRSFVTSKMTKRNVTVYDRLKPEGSLMSRVLRSSAVIGWLAALGLVGMSAVARSADVIDFTRDIRPILSDKCFTCHGPDDGRREGGFRLDEKESSFGEADSGERPIVPGDVESSELLRRMTSEDELEKMPPPESDKEVSSEEIALIQRWIKEGASWKQHWAFVPPRRVPPPEVQHKAWPRSPIDTFILARLEEEGLAPSPDADKAVLLRRVTLDLTGLPPSLKEVEAFQADDSPRAFEKVVDRLLRSPRYGEHMARFWLDAARYADTNGLHLDNYREMWPYRDWVVRAFNQNMPFDQFLVEQLAGDLLPNPTLDQLVATGFNRCHITTNEGGSIKEEVYVRNVVDRVVTTSTVFMGVTFECTRCHDHKYDPFTMKDFYSLFAYFNSIDGEPLDGNKKDHAPVVRVPSERQQKRLETFDKQIAALDAKLREPWPEIDALQVVWEKELLALEKSPADKVTITLGDWYWVGPFTENRRYLVSRKHGPEGKDIDLAGEFDVGTGSKLAWVKRPDWTDGTTHVDLPGDTVANFLYRNITVSKATTVPVSLGSDDGIKVYLNNKQILANDVARGVAADQESVDLKLKEGENHLLLKIMNYGGATGFYFALKSDESGIPSEIVDLAKVDVADRKDEQRLKLREYFRNKVAHTEEWMQAKSELAGLRKSRADVDRTVPSTLIWKEAESLREAFLLKRGEYDQPGEKVSRRTPSVLPPMDSGLPNDRLGLARWFVDSDHPLTARVTVNRLWQQFFGTGLVKTTEDFGSQGEPPSHAEMLDWLAVEFMESGWDVRELVKQIVMSATYRQSSRVSREGYARDPDNRLLARGPRFRLDAEMLRDQALFIGGLLVDKRGGPSVKPPQPDGLWFAVGYSGSNTVRFAGDDGPDKVHRRTLYTFIKRTAPPPQMSIIDAPSREACVVRRERTNTPLQALLLMNDPQFFEAAGALAKRTIRNGGKETTSRAAFMLRLCTCRAASEWEIEELSQDFRDHLDEFSSDPDAGKKVAQVGERGSDSSIDQAELAAWTMVANLVLNLDEVVSKN